MRLGYMTNAFGPLVGAGAGVTSVKDIRYLTMCDDGETMKTIRNIGFEYIEVLDGNLTKYAENIDELKEMMKSANVQMMSVCIGANFIYKDALEDEMEHVEEVCKAAKEVGVTYLVICGGAIRKGGIRPGDTKLLAEGIDEAEKIAKKYGLIACFHPHLGSIAERPKEIDELLSYSNIKVCPDVAHLAAGGYDPQKFIEKYYDRITLIHLKDLNSEGFAPLGKGKIDLKGVIAYVKSRGYEGDWLVEVDGYAGDAKEACEISYEYLKNNLL